MQQYRREWIPVATYLFSVNTYRRQRSLTDPPFNQALKSTIKEVKRTLPFEIEAFVLLPAHLHCIWKIPEDNSDYGVRWSLIKRKVSPRCKKYLNRNTTKSRLKHRVLGFLQRLNVRTAHATLANILAIPATNSLSDLP
jgi:putative transposase